jgi:hypothetical protein
MSQISYPIGNIYGKFNDDFLSSSERQKLEDSFKKNNLNILEKEHFFNYYLSKDNKEILDNLSMTGSESFSIKNNKIIKEILLNRDNSLFIDEFSILPFSIETTILFKQMNSKKYIESHLILNKHLLLILKRNKIEEQKDNSINSNYKLKESFIQSNNKFTKKGINFKDIKKLYDIFHPILCLNFDLVTAKVTGDEKNNEISIQVLSNKILIFKLKTLENNKKLFQSLLQNLSLNILLSNGYMLNLLTISLEKDFYLSYYISLSDFESKANTGDILLFRGRQIQSKIQRCYTKDKYDHVAIIHKKYHNLFIYEATSNFGCKEKSWHEFIFFEYHLFYKKIAFRKLIINESNYENKCNIINNLNDKFDEYLDLTEGKDYKIKISSIICGCKDIDSQNKNKWRKKDGFICSSLVFGAYLDLGICEITKDIEQILPGDFSHDKYLKFNKPFDLSPEIIIDFSS